MNRHHRRYCFRMMIGWCLFQYALHTIFARAVSAQVKTTRCRFPLMPLPRTTGHFENDIAAILIGISAISARNLGRNGPEPIPICGAPPPQPAPRGKHCRRRGIWRRNTPSRHKKRAWCPAAVLLHLCPSLGFKTAPHHSSDEVSNVGGL